MRISFEGREYDWDPTMMTVEEAIFLEDKANLGLNEFNSALTLGKGRALAALVYLAKTRAGEAVRWQDMMRMNLASYAVLPDQQDEQPAESEKDKAKPDPSLPGGGNPEPDISATS